MWSATVKMHDDFMRLVAENWTPLSVEELLWKPDHPRLAIAELLKLRVSHVREGEPKVAFLSLASGH